MYQPFLLHSFYSLFLITGSVCRPTLSPDSSIVTGHSPSTDYKWNEVVLSEHECNNKTTSAITKQDDDVSPTKNSVFPEEKPSPINLGKCLILH